jgi:AraC family transcriptional regulator of adaptative response/methylated-DNA-[protein]-cysteine methyltransferase
MPTAASITTRPGDEPIRTRPDDEHGLARHYEMVARAIIYLREHAVRQPGLDEVARVVGLSPFHLQRVFAQWVGISPKRFLQFLTKEYALEQLRRSTDVLETSDRAGLGSASRLHDLMVSCEAMTPGEIRLAGAGLAIGLGLGPTPLGHALVAWTDRGLCELAFVEDAGSPMLAELAARWPRARITRDDAAAAGLLARVFAEPPERGRLHLILRGTNFQIRVWEALMRTAPGDRLAYGELARRIGSPGAARAVGSALAANRLAWLIPCHRVIRESGEPGRYRWGEVRKEVALGWEAARAASGPPG